MRQMTFRRRVSRPEPPGCPAGCFRDAASARFENGAVRTMTPKNGLQYGINADLRRLIPSLRKINETEAAAAPLGCGGRFGSVWVIRPAAVPQTPIGICSAERVTARGAVISFHFESAWLTAGNGRRLTNLPRPGCGWSFWPCDQTTSPRDSV